MANQWTKLNLSERITKSFGEDLMRTRQLELHSTLNDVDTNGSFDERKYEVLFRTVKECNPEILSMYIDLLPENGEQMDQSQDCFYTNLVLGLMRAAKYLITINVYTPGRWWRCRNEHVVVLYKCIIFECPFLINVNIEFDPIDNNIKREDGGLSWDMLFTLAFNVRRSTRFRSLLYIQDKVSQNIWDIFWIFFACDKTYSEYWKKLDLRRGASAFSVQFEDGIILDVDEVVAQHTFPFLQTDPDEPEPNKLMKPEIKASSFGKDIIKKVWEEYIVPLTKKIGTGNNFLRPKYVKDAKGFIVIEEDGYYDIVSKMGTEDFVVAVKLTDYFRMHRVCCVLIQYFKIDIASFWRSLFSDVRMKVKSVNGLSRWYWNMMHILDDEYCGHTNEIVPFL